jgi:asparagine synthase (glutamine-hydrolysing)
MCGIAGIVSVGSDRPPDDTLSKMVRVQSHRGPDGQGCWFGQVGPIHLALGSVRLAIQDLSDAGSQPLASPSGRQVLIYNGEVYNYLELRRELQACGIEFRSRCDTEVVLYALKVWGERAFERFNGMWGLAWLDQDAGQLLLSRDRLGIKPLYWHRSHGRLFFASEIKSILVASNRRFSVNEVAVARYLLQSQLDAQEQTFFRGIEALPPGTCARFDLRSAASLSPSLHRYWNPPSERLNGTPPSVDTVRETFLDSVRLRLRSDVPVGVLLSGGLDSSSIAAATQLATGRSADLHLLSIVSDDPRYNEGPFIDRMAAHLGKAAHTSRVRITPQETFGLLDHVTWHNDEPLISLSNVAHYLLMQQAKELGATVILSGQGADELLCGYLKYWGFYLQSLCRDRRWLTALRVLGQLSRRGTALPQFRVDEAKRYLPRLLRPAAIDVRGPRLNRVDSLLDIGLGPAGVVERQVADLCRFSVPALLHWEDRMSMAAAREIRVPYLDYRLVETLLPLDPQWKLRDGWSKWVLRKAMEPHLPREITWRKDKQGFVIPQSEWFKTVLRQPVTALLEGDLLTAACGFVDRAALQRRYATYCRQPSDGGRISFNDVFNPIALEVWMRRFESYLKLDA